MNKKGNICVLQMNHTISHQINETCKQKSSMSKKYSYSCSSCMNGNISLGKHFIEDSMQYSDRMIQFTSLFIHDTSQKFKSSKTFTIVQFNKICELGTKSSERGIPFYGSPGMLT